ncbi:uncharacterized protein LOC132064643 [Lycium ferocissimum]|uniref:uncharacterized protein LOC132064643 n=1 Tax=Lycium ferocissimum TaxID=112874 RepID=UPI0028162D51|nr:uncharacterized protein LOC132064643 [Lycium ferocissimum]
MAQNPNNLHQNMTHHLLQENKQSFRHPPPRPPPPRNPKNLIPVNSTNSNSNSSSSLLDQLSKRVTRDLPNFSDCHGCDVRINHTDPNDRLQTLDSVWRIVLLCKKCIRRVSTGQTCPYCFKNTDDDECFKCCSCKRSLHKECVSRYGNSEPWSFCYSEEGVKLGSFVCIDCWVPRFFRKSIGVCKKTLNFTTDVKSFGRIGKDANFEGKRTVVLALRARDTTLRIPLRKPAVAKNESELVNKKDKNKGLLKSSSISRDDDTNLIEAVNDAEFAFQLHRAMNNSRRISKTICPVNSSSYVGDPENLESSNVSCKLLDLGQTVSNYPGDTGLKVYSRNRYKGKVVRTSSEAPPSVIVYSRTRLKEKVGQTSSETPPCVAVYSRTKLKEKVDKASSDTSPCVMVYSRRLKEQVCQTCSEAPPCVTMNEHGSCVDSACSKAELLTYKRSRLKRKMCEERVGLSDLMTEELNLGDDDCRDFSGLRASQREFSQHNLCPLSSGGDNTVQGEFSANNTVQAESCNTQQDRFLLKYSRRKKCSEPGSDVHENTFPQPTPDPNIPTNWSVESRASSNVSSNV